MNIKLVLPFLLLAPALAHGQQQIKRKPVQLKATVQEVMVSSLPVAGIEIVNSLPDSTSLGFVNNAAGKQILHLSPEGNCTSWLQQYVDASYKNAFKSKGKKLVWVIKDLNVGSDMKDPNAYLLHLKAVGYASSDNINYDRLFSVDTLMIGNNTTQPLEEMIVQGVQSLYHRSVNAGVVAKSAATDQLNRNEVINDAIRNYNLPILKAKQYKQGIYRSFEEFSSNNPSLPNVMINQDQNGNVVLYRLASDSTQVAVTDAWGVCFNNELYALQKGMLLPLERRGNTISLSRFLEPENRINPASFQRNFTNLDAFEGNPFSEKTALPVPIPSLLIQPEATKIDLETGNLTF